MDFSDVKIGQRIKATKNDVAIEGIVRSRNSNCLRFDELTIFKSQDWSLELISDVQFTGWVRMIARNGNSVGMFYSDGVKVFTDENKLNEVGSIQTVIDWGRTFEKVTVLKDHEVAVATGPGYCVFDGVTVTTEDVSLINSKSPNAARFIAGIIDSKVW